MARRHASVDSVGRATLTEVLPRACTFAIWWNSWLHGTASLDDVVDSHTRTGQQILATPQGNQPFPVGLIELLTEHQESRSMWQARVVLPAPGHVDGLPAIPGLAAEAITAGQAVIFDSVGIVLVPTIDAHTTWKTFSQESSLVDPTTASASIRPEQARWAIRTAIADATTLLAATDTAAGRDAISDSMRRVQTELDRFTWPADTSPEQRATVLQAAQVLAIATTALHHDSTVHGSVNVTAARTQSLTDLAHTARRCLAAACSTR